MNPFFTQAFREAAPYIHYLRGKTLVIGLSSTLLAPDVLPNLAADLNLMAALGIRLVLVYDADAQIAALCRQSGYEPQYHNGRAVCSETLLRHAKQACGEIQFDVQAALSLGFAHSPQRTPRLHIGSGNFVFAQPMGVIGGIDMAYTGVLRKINGAAIEHALDNGAVVLIPPLAVSAAGQVYQLCMQEIAQAAALSVRAEKLVFLIDEDGIVNTEGTLFSELTAEQARNLCRDGQIPAAQQTLLATAIDTVEQGISRVQILSGRQNGALLGELFTRNGAGTAIAQTPFVRIRAAHTDDIADLAALIEPLAEQGILLPRSRDYFAQHVHRFYLLEHDRQIYGCAELKTFDDAPSDAELGCLAVSPNARDGGCGELLLAHLVREAKSQGKTRLFALSTRAADWFTERGFLPAQAADLPPQRQAQYHQQARQSKIFVLPLD